MGSVDLGVSAEWVGIGDWSKEKESTRSGMGERAKWNK